MTEPVKIILHDRIEWRLDDKLHRIDGPAIEFANKAKFWYRHGKKHREDGPAMEWADGNKEYWLDNIEYTEEEWFKEIVRRWGKP